MANSGEKPWASRLPSSAPSVAMRRWRSLSANVARGFHTACDDIKPARAFLIHAGDDRYPVSDKLEAISVRQLMAEFQQLA